MVLLGHQRAAGSGVGRDGTTDKIEDKGFFFQRSSPCLDKRATLLELRGVSCRYASIADDSEAAGEGRLVRCPDVSIACDERVWDALRVAGADFVSALPDGLDTRLGEGGAGLSEGQVQRLAIARAIFADRPVLLLDEATCSLDPETERRVLENLRALPDKTVIAVTHRPAALEVCDRQVRFGEQG